MSERMTHPLAALIAEKANDARDVFDGTCDTAKQSVDYFEQLLLAALEAALIAGVKVKPLVWVDSVANTSIGPYQIKRSGEKYRAVCSDRDYLRDEHGRLRNFFDEEDAQTAAQADYEARIIAALEAATPPDLGEAGKVLDRLESHMGKADIAEVLRDCRQATDTIRALIALATAQAAQIAGLERDLREKTALAEDMTDQVANLLPAVNREAVEQRSRAEAAEAKVAELEAQIAVMIDAEAEAATLRAEVERLRGALPQLATDLITERDALHTEVERLRAALSKVREQDRSFVVHGNGPGEAFYLYGPLGRIADAALEGKHE